MMIAEISAGISSLKLAKDIVQALNGMQTAAAINDVKLTLQSHILDAQQGLFAAQEIQSLSAKRISDLEQEIVSLKDWSTEKQRYELKRYAPGSLAYTLKPGMAQGEPPHHLCTNCYDRGIKSRLQATNDAAMGRRTYECPSCRNKIPLGQEMSSEPPAKS